MKPTVSVAMAVHNEVEHLAEAVQSILDQSYADFEFLITDDGSTDASLDIVREFASADDRISIIENGKRLGLTRCLNRLLHIADGHIIVRMDGNDISKPTRFERQVSMLVEGQLDMVWCNAIYIDDRGRPICERHQAPLRETLALLPHPNHVVHAGSAYRKQSVLAVGGYDDRYESGQDGELWRRMRDAGFRFGLIEESLLKVRVEQRSVTGRRLNYPADMSIVYARVCMTNGDREKAKQYIAQVADPWQRFQLLARLALGERLAKALKRLRPYSYDRVHRRS